jgi:hypothetical protein
VPSEETICAERLCRALGGIQQHLHNAFHVMVCGSQCPDVEAKASGDRGADLVTVQDFVVDLAGLQDVQGQSFQNRFLAQPKASIRPISLPWRWRTTATVVESPSWSHLKLGQSLDSWMYTTILRTICGKNGGYSPLVKDDTRLFRGEGPGLDSLRA